MALTRSDPYLERLRLIQAEVAGLDARISSLEAGFALDVRTADAIVRSRYGERPARYDDFLTAEQIRDIAIRHERALNRGCECDALDYALSATCGVICGLLDAILVSVPGEGQFGKATDVAFDKAVVAFARRLKDGEGNPVWNPKAGNENSLPSAIGALERQFKVGYDQQTSKAVGGRIAHLSAKNHHAKSIGHYPDIIGLVASVCNQFTGTSTFFGTGGHGIVVVAGTGGGVELVGSTTTEKVYAGIINWLCHCMSDVAGSSGSKTRGAGLPIPFSEFFQLCEFGRFANDKGQWQSLATVMTQVYEQGYDLRHAVTASFPVIINDLTVRTVYALKRHLYSGVSWSECLPRRDSPEMQRMLTIGVGTMCLVDLGHAAATSWGNWVKLFAELNVAAWARLGMQGVRELELAANRDTRNLLSTNEDISQEWSMLLERSQDLLS